MTEPALERSPDPESVRAALHQAWRDHHHVRDQTWKAVQIEAVLAAGLVTVDLQYQALLPTLLAALLICWAALFGIWISLHHRRVEAQKFRHITNLERHLGLVRDDLIPESSIGPARALRWWHIFDLRQHNTAAFILRMHASILLFALVVVGAGGSACGRGVAGRVDRAPR